MSSSTAQHWLYTIFAEGYNSHRHLVAEYVAQVPRESLDIDLSHDMSRLRQYLSTYFNIDPKEFIQRHAVRAQALLGGLVAQYHCLLEMGIVLPVEAPPAQAITKPDSLGDPVFSESGVVLWLVQKKEIPTVLL